jgi:hypothetical protein
MMQGFSVFLSRCSDFFIGSAKRFPASRIGNIRKYLLPGQEWLLQIAGDRAGTGLYSEFGVSGSVTDCIAVLLPGSDKTGGKNRSGERSESAGNNFPCIR